MPEVLALQIRLTGKLGVVVPGHVLSILIHYILYSNYVDVSVF